MKHVRKITGTNPLGHSKWTLTTHNSTALRREFEISHLNKEQRDDLFRCFCCCRLNKRPFENLNIFQDFWIRFDVSFPLHYSRRSNGTWIIPNQIFSQIRDSATQRFSVVWRSWFRPQKTKKILDLDPKLAGYGGFEVLEVPPNGPGHSPRG